jgi:tetratricopeptide (TPR) repeat protein
MKSASKWVAAVGALALMSAGCKKEELSPAEKHRSAGNTLMKQKKYKEATEEYAKSLAIDPKQDKLWETKAMAHVHAGEQDLADESMVKMAENRADPLGKAEVYRNLAGYHVGKGDAGKGELYFSKAVELNPNDDVSLAWLGEIYAQRGGARGKAPVNSGYLEKSLGYYDRVLALTPTAANPHINKRIALIKYMSYLTEEKTRLEGVAKATKDKAQATEMLAQATEIGTRLEQYKTESEMLLAKFKELSAAAKAKATAEATK